MANAQVTIKADHENNAEDFWANLDAVMPELAYQLRSGQATIDADVWAAVQNVEGFSDGPSHARNALVVVESAPEFPNTTTATQYDAQGFQLANNVSVQWIEDDDVVCEQVRIGRSVYRADEMRVEQHGDEVRLVGPGGWYLVD